MLSTKKYVRIKTVNDLRWYQLELIKYIKEVGRRSSIQSHRKATSADFNAGLKIIAQYATNLARYNKDKTIISKTQVRSIIYLRNLIPAWDGTIYCVLPTRTKFILEAIRRLTKDNIVNPGHYLHNMQFTSSTSYVDFAIHPQHCAMLAMASTGFHNQPDLKIVFADIVQHHTSHKISNDW